MSTDQDEKSNEPDLKNLLERGRLALYQDLVNKIEAGTATHQEKSLFYKMLQEAGLAWVPDAGERQAGIVNQAAEGLPDFESGGDGDE